MHADNVFQNSPIHFSCSNTFCPPITCPPILPKGKNRENVIKGTGRIRKEDNLVSQKGEGENISNSRRQRKKGRVGTWSQVPH